MGFVGTAGKPLTFEEILKIVKYIKEEGVKQLCNLIMLRKDKKSVAPLKWGDEMEYHLVSFDHTKKKARLLLHAKDFQDSYNAATDSEGVLSKFHIQAEYGAWVLEVIPKIPHKEISIRVLAGLESYF
jgi:glutamate--cysteine ligase catalytic subunit